MYRLIGVDSIIVAPMLARYVHRDRISSEYTAAKETEKSSRSGKRNMLVLPLDIFVWSLKSLWKPIPCLRSFWSSKQRSVSMTELVFLDFESTSRPAVFAFPCIQCKRRFLHGFALLLPLWSPIIHLLRPIHTSGCLYSAITAIGSKLSPRQEKTIRRSWLSGPD